MRAVASRERSHFLDTKEISYTRRSLLRGFRKQQNDSSRFAGFRPCLAAAEAGHKKEQKPDLCFMLRTLRIRVFTYMYKSSFSAAGLLGGCRMLGNNLHLYVHNRNRSANCTYGWTLFEWTLVPQQPKEKNSSLRLVFAGLVFTSFPF